MNPNDDKPPRRKPRHASRSAAAPEPVTRVRLTDRGAHGGAVLTMFLVVALAASYLASFLLALFRMPPSAIAYVAPLLALAMAVPGWRATQPTEAVIGADGVTIRSYGWKRFIPLHRIERIRGDERSLEIFLHGGKSRRITTYTEFSPERIEELAEAVAEAQKAGRQAPPRPGPSPHLERRGRTIDAWRRDLRALTSEGRDYRRASLSAGDLAAVLEDVEAPTEQRIGAALALAEAGDTGARPRIRIAADASANEALRVALASLAEGEGDEQALEEALAAEPQRGPTRA
jgi:hypothetical protein